MKRATTKRRVNRKHKRTMKKRTGLKFEDVDYATDIDVLTIMSKEKQIAALNKVKQFLKSSKNKEHIKEIMKRKKQIEELIKEN